MASFMVVSGVQGAFCSPQTLSVPPLWQPHQRGSLGDHGEEDPPRQPHWAHRGLQEGSGRWDGLDSWPFGCVGVMTPALCPPSLGATASFLLLRLGPGLRLRSPSPPHPLTPSLFPCEWIPCPPGFHPSNRAVSEHLLGAKRWGAG